MYLEHFRLNREPFSIAPDPGFLYLSAGHNEALTHLQYGLSHGGFVLITGEVGTGKTTLLRNLVRMTPDHMDIAFILNPRLTAKELLETICDELGIPYDRTTTVSIKHYIDVLTRHLLQSHRAGRSTVLVIDEAQNLAPAVLEQIRLLTNLETDERKLLRIILIGQPELGEMLSRTELRQLSQRITARYTLGPLNTAETVAYVAHRLSTAGGNPRIFTDAAVRLLHREAGGIPRLINTIADRALLGAYSRGVYEVNPSIIRQAAREITPVRRSAWSLRNVTGIALTATAIVLIVFLAGRYLMEVGDSTIPAQALPQLPETSTLRPAAGNPLPDGPVVPAGAGTDEPAAAADGTRSPIVRPSINPDALQRSAYAAVFKTWGVEYDGDTGRAPCEFAQQVRLLCASRSGTWADIEILDLPVILELHDGADTPFHAAVVAGNSTRMTLIIAGNSVEVGARDLKTLWFGNFSFLWPQPPLFREPLQKGDLDDSVAILRDRLERALGRPISYTISNVFDDKLAEALTEFQQREALPLEPAAGPMTWVRLARVNASRPMPSLRAGPVTQSPAPG